MEGPNKHWGIEKKKLTSGGGGDVYLALKSKHFIHFSIGVILLYIYKDTEIH